MSSFNGISFGIFDQDIWEGWGFSYLVLYNQFILDFVRSTNTGLKNYRVSQTNINLDISSTLEEADKIIFVFILI